MHRIRIVTGLLMLVLGSLSPAAAAAPDLIVNAPQDGAVIGGDRVTVSFTTANIKLVPTTVPVSEAGKHPEANRPGEGHVHFVLDLQPLVVLEKGDAYTFSNVPPGEHQLMVELVKNDHSSFSPPVVQQIQFRTSITPQTMPATGTAPDADVAPGLLGLVLLLVIAGFALRRWQM